MCLSPERCGRVHGRVNTPLREVDLRLKFHLVRVMVRVEEVVLQHQPAEELAELPQPNLDTGERVCRVCRGHRCRGHDTCPLPSCLGLTLS
jgi:hypothetical protein